jgi:ribosomal protein S12 methylthiotransferase accessory factor YcaO
LEESNQVSFQLFDVVKSDLPVFLQPFHFVDAEIKTEGGSTFLGSGMATKGSGVDGSFLSASCHALGEALERHLGFLSGTKDSRKSQKSVLSWSKKDWLDLDFDPFGSDPKVNSFWSPDGQACHPSLEEAFRNALGELLERNKLATVRASDPWFDVTESVLAMEPHARVSKDYWDGLGFNFNVFVGLGLYGGFVSMATAVAKDLDQARGNLLSGSKGRYGASYRGSAGDFRLDYGPMQAISELNRSAHFGPYLGLVSDQETREAQSKISSQNYYFGYMERLLKLDWLHQMASSNCILKTIDELRELYTFTPKSIIERLADRYGDVYVIPYAVPASSGVYGIKLAVPGLDVSAVSRVKV